MQTLKTPEEVDQIFRWPIGKAERLARHGKIPCIVLPDGAIRFEQSTVENLVKRMPATKDGGA